MSETGNLKLPIRTIELYGAGDGCGYIHDADDNEISAYGTIGRRTAENKEFGALIVTAVNAHSALVEALEDLLAIDNVREASGLSIHRMPAHARKKVHAALRLAEGEKE